MRLKTYLGLRFRRLTINKYPNLHRPSSEPYLSGDTLRKMADHIFDETKTLNPKMVNTNDIVFLKTELKEIYFNHYHKDIKSRYLLISHNSDFSINKEDLQYLDNKIIHWFAMKLNVEMNENISPIPSGLENSRFMMNGKVSNFNKTLNNDKFNLDSKREKIFCSFNEHTNYEERHPLMKIIQDRKDIDIKKFDRSIDYLSELSKYKYNLCPEGNNFESHRIWESLLFRSTPIVLNNYVNQNFYNLGVPLILINNWDILNDLTMDDLNNMNKENEKKDYEKFVSFDFWKKLILSKRI